MRNRSRWGALPSLADLRNQLLVHEMASNERELLLGREK
jgi:hypothetical protein